MFFPHTTTTTARPPLPPLSALANAHIWANGVLDCSPHPFTTFPPATSSPATPANTTHDNTSWEGRRRLEKVDGGGGKGWRRGDDDEAA